MTRGRKFKKKVREHMRATGTNYMSARKYLMDNPRKKCDHIMIPQGPQAEDLVCKECGFSKPNPDRV